GSFQFKVPSNAYLLTASVVGSLAAPVFMGASSTVAGLQGSTVYIVAWFLVAVTLLPGLTSFFMLKPDPQEIAKNLHRYYPASQVSSSTSNVAPTKQRSTREILAFYPVTAAIVAAATTQGVMTMMMALFSLMMAEHGIFLVAISASITIHVIGMFGFSILLGRVADRMGRKKVLASCLVVSAVGALMIPMSQDYWFMTVGIFLVGLGWSGGIVASTAILADSTHPDERGRTIGVNDTISGGAAVSFPIIGGILIGLFGFAALGYASAIATIPALAAILLLREPKPGVYAAKPSAVRL
ncbi:MAG: MFS transporter, partial [Candidatus Bathyarchaeia archaeon]